MPPEAIFASQFWMQMAAAILGFPMLVKFSSLLAWFGYRGAAAFELKDSLICHLGQYIIILGDERRKHNTLSH